MTRVDIGDGGPPLDLPDTWLPDWQTHVRAAVQRGQQRRAQLRQHRHAAYLLRNHNASPERIATLTGLPIREVAAIVAAHQAPAQPDRDDTWAKIMRYPLRDPDPVITGSLADPSQPTYRLTMTITPIE